MKAVALISFAAIAVAVVLFLELRRRGGSSQPVVRHAGRRRNRRCGRRGTAVLWRSDGYPWLYVVWVSPKREWPSPPVSGCCSSSCSTARAARARGSWSDLRLAREGRRRGLRRRVPDRSALLRDHGSSQPLVDQVERLRILGSATIPMCHTAAARLSGVGALARQRYGLPARVDHRREARAPHLDAKRVYLSGFSNGGGMCARVGVEMSDVFAAVGCNAGGLDAVHPTTPADHDSGSAGL